MLPSFRFFCVFRMTLHSLHIKELGERRLEGASLESAVIRSSGEHTGIGPLCSKGQHSVVGQCTGQVKISVPPLM